MFIALKDLERQPLGFRETFVPGTIDFRTREFRQSAALTVELSAALEGPEIHVTGRLDTRLEMPCARCLDAVERRLAPRFDLFYRPVATISREEEISLRPEELEVGFFVDDGLFLADVVAEQVHLALPMKVVCHEECRGLCPGCGANLNRERCKCGPRAVDPRLAPLAEWAGKRNQT